MAGQKATIGNATGKLQEMLDRSVESGRIPSAIGALGLEGEIEWLATSGEMGPGTPMREDAIIPLASAGKMYTATAVMLLVEDGNIGVDDPVSDYIPEFGELMVEDDAGLVSPESPVTIHHLLTHTGGLTVDGDRFWEAWNAHSGKTTTGHLARALAALPLQSHPGKGFAYGMTGASYEVLGAMVEVVSGQTLEEFMTDRIFRPLGLKDSFFYLPDEKKHRLPAFYRMADGELVLERAMGEEFPRSRFFHGGGGVQASAADVLRFGRLFLEGGSVGEALLLSPPTVETMMTDQVGDLIPLPGLGWGYGAAIRSASGAYGWVGGGYAKVWVDRALDMVAYFAFPLVPPGDAALLEELEQMLYAGLAAD